MKIKNDSSVLKRIPWIAIIVVWFALASAVAACITQKQSNQNFRIYDGENVLLNLAISYEFQIAIALIIFVFCIVLFCMAIFSSLLPVKHQKEIWLAWLLVLFGGAYFVFGMNIIGVLKGTYAVSRMLAGLSMMFYMLTGALIITRFLHGKLNKAALLSIAALSLVTFVSIFVSLNRRVEFNDVYPWWNVAAALNSVFLAVCIALDALRRVKSLRWMDDETKKVYLPALAVLLAFVVDTFALFFDFWQGGALTLLVFFLMIFMSAFVIGRIILDNLRTLIDAKNLEAEKQAMEMKLQESQISIMLSQIQPHFLYNTLNSIYHLCETNPMRARSMVNSFAEYLRNNLSTLEETGLISFETELEHIKTYLDIEKVRFEDTLEIEYDVKCVEFSLPVLTVQPIVENAVKHGTSKKRGGGKVIICTEEEKECYVIKVYDTGCGFDPSKPKDDGKRHIGIENVRQRLSNMCSGTLTIESEVGIGTLVTIRIPKGVKNENYSRR